MSRLRASGTDPRCYPIEVAIANAAVGGNVRQWLIAPTPAWLETGLWQAEAEAIHGLSRAEIIAFGRCVHEVAAELTAWTRGATVLSDAPTHDTKWLRDLYAATGTEPPFALLDFDQFVWRAAAVRGRRPDLAIVKAEAEAYALFPKQHRAGPDAQRNAEILRQVQTMPRGLATERFPLVRCRLCGWVHIGIPAPNPWVGHDCFRCKGGNFEVISNAEFRRTVPPGVTLQGLRWPPDRS